jgi:hypothetical protein
LDSTPLLVHLVIFQIINTFSIFWILSCKQGNNAYRNKALIAILFFRIKEHCADDGHVLGTPHIYEYLWRVLYNRRSKFNPLWNSLVVGGIHKGEK